MCVGGVDFGSQQVGRLGGSITVEGITLTGSGSIGPVVSMVATKDDASIVFNGTSSTFNAFAAQADSGIVVDVDLTATGGLIYMDGDLDNSAADDAQNSIVIAANKTLKGSGIMTLESTSGLVVASGALTLFSGAGMVIWEDITASAANQLMVLNSDYDLSGDGTLTLAASKTATSNNGETHVTAWDLDLPGSINAGDATMLVHASKPSQTISIGVTQKDMHITDDELSRITATQGLTIGSSTSGSITLRDVSAASSDSIGTLQLVATKANAQVLPSPSTLLPD